MTDEEAGVAKAICSTCPVREACLEHALSAREREGIWGGATERERRRILRQGGSRPDRSKCRQARSAVRLTRAHLLGSMPSAAQQVLRVITMHVWIDGEGLLRRVPVTLPTPPPPRASRRSRSRWTGRTTAQL